MPTKKELSEGHCVPCEGGVKPLKGKDISKNLKDLSGWRAIKQHHLYKAYKLKDFVSALKFVNEVGKIAEKEGHHPDLQLGWGYVNISLFTHAIKGLSVNDFILAAKIDVMLDKKFNKAPILRRRK